MDNLEEVMKKALIVGAILTMLLAGCGAETEKADSTGPGKRQKVENSAPVTEDNYTAEDVARDAAAANDEVTLEVLGKMSGDYAILLGNCQLIKYQQENGAAAMEQWTDGVVEEGASASSGDVVSVQEAMIKEGYSCTFQEMNRVAASGTLREQ
jgi:PBP1b-binding outer membrane lipoprotein LpoB